MKKNYICVKYSIDENNKRKFKTRDLAYACGIWQEAYS